MYAHFHCFPVFLFHSCRKVGCVYTYDYPPYFTNVLWKINGVLHVHQSIPNNFHYALHPQSRQLHPFYEIDYMISTCPTIPVVTFPQNSPRETYQQCARRLDLLAVSVSTVVRMFSSPSVSHRLNQPCTTPTQVSPRSTRLGLHSASRRMRTKWWHKRWGQRKAARNGKVKGNEVEMKKRKEGTREDWLERE